MPFHAAGGCTGSDAPEEECGHVLVAIRGGAFVRRTGETEILHDLTHAHMTRSIRAQTGHTPTACRRLLAEVGRVAG